MNALDKLIRGHSPIEDAILWCEDGGNKQVADKAAEQYFEILAASEASTDLLNAIAKKLDMDPGRDLHEILSVLDERLK
jgi:hypothetical protein